MLASCTWLLASSHCVKYVLAGESFFDAGRSVTDLLTRNFLKAYGVWWCVAYSLYRHSCIQLRSLIVVKAVNLTGSQLAHLPHGTACAYRLPLGVQPESIPQQCWA